MEGTGMERSGKAWKGAERKGVDWLLIAL